MTSKTSKTHKLLLGYYWMVTIISASSSCCCCCFVDGFVAPLPTRIGATSTTITTQRSTSRMVPSTATATTTHSIRRTIRPLHSYIKGIELSDLLYDETSMAFDAWEWTANLGAPAALVAGAVLVTLSETRTKYSPRKNDKKYVRLGKLATRFLLMTSFALEVVSIFVSTVTGTVLLSHGPATSAKKLMVGYTCPLALLHHHHEFEYLTIQIGFLQGLIHWLIAVALEFLLPADANSNNSNSETSSDSNNETVSAKRMNKFMASCLMTLVMWIVAFYNHHLTFYSDYLGMNIRYFYLFYKRFFGGTFRPMSLLYGPSSILCGILGWRAFRSPPDEDDD